MLFGSVAHVGASSSYSSLSLPRFVTSSSISSSGRDSRVARTPSMSLSSCATTTTTTAPRFSVAMSPLLLTTSSASASPTSASSMLPLLLVLRGGGGAISNKALKKPSSLRNAAAAAVKGKKALAATSSSLGAATAILDDGDKSSSSGGNALSRWWFGHIPQIIRFFVSGNLGTLCFYACERFMYRVVFHSDNVISLFPDYEALLHSYKDSASFLLGYLLHIVAQHYLHALLVYGHDSINTSRKYWTTLFGMYQALMFAAFGSTFLNAALLPFMHRTAAFVATLCIFACINYVWIGRIVSKASSSSSSSTESVEHDKKKKKDKKKATLLLIKNKKTASSSSSMMGGRALRGGALQSSSSSSCYRTTSSGPSLFQQDDSVL
jgi:hypothetical protein